MAKEKQTSKQEAIKSSENNEQKAISAVKSYLLEQLPRGLTAGKQITISKEEPKEVEVLREFSWDIPVFQKLESENLKEEEQKEAKKVLEAVNYLKKQGYKVYLTKIQLKISEGGKQS